MCDATNTDAALQLLDGEVRVLQWHCGQPNEPSWVLPDDICHVVVEESGPLHDGIGGGVVVEEHGHCGDSLDVDAGSIHLGDACERIPAVLVDLAEELAVLHHARFALRVVVVMQCERDAVRQTGQWCSSWMNPE